MKTKINKSEVMKEAWHLYRLLNRWNGVTRKFYNNKIIRSFFHCLKRAWENIKAQMKRPVINSAPCYITQDGYNAFYSNTKYFGD